MRAVAVLVLLAGLALAPPARAAVEVEARLDRDSAVVGESVALVVVVRGALSGVGEPDLRLPRGLEILGTAREQRMAWVNGRSSVEKIVRYEIAILEPGRYTIGPIRVPVGGQVLQAPARTLVVPAEASGGGGGRTASLLVDVEPREPWVGQPVQMRVRLLLAQEPAAEPAIPKPPTPGFWAEAAGPMTWSYATQAGRHILVAEFRTVLLPLTPGVAHVGSTGLMLAFDDRGDDALARQRAGLPSRRLVSVRSAPLDLRVRPLPPGAPRGFDGAVGDFRLKWSADRVSTSQDVPVTVRLDVRGMGNLPLVKAPALTCPDGEVSAGGSQDSLAAPGVLAAGRRSFSWSVLPHRVGRIEIPAPRFVWFDAGSGTYRTAVLSSLPVQVGPNLFSARGSQETFPGVFLRDAPDPFGRGVAPWAWALAGLLLGAAWVSWRRRPPVDPHVEDRARLATWRNALKAQAGPAFWRAAEEVTAWLEAQGRTVGAVRSLVEATRYGGGQGNADAVRVRLATELASALPAAPRLRGTRPVAVALALAAVGALVVSGVRPGESAGSMRLRAADQAARAGDPARARAAWEALWREGGRAPALAARLAWIEVSGGSVARAAVWVLRGERGDARDPGLVWVSDLVREGGGLAGDRGTRLPVRRIEWAAVALALGLLAGTLGRRRALAAGAVALCLLCAGADPAQRWWAGRAERLVVARGATLEGAGLDLEPGQVVRVIEREGGRIRVRAGRDAEGVIPVSSVLEVGEDR